MFSFFKVYAHKHVYVAMFHVHSWNCSPGLSLLLPKSASPNSFQWCVKRLQINHFYSSTLNIIYHDFSAFLSLLFFHINLKNSLFTSFLSQLGTCTCKEDNKYTSCGNAIDFIIWTLPWNVRSLTVHLAKTNLTLSNFACQFFVLVSLLL